MKHTTIHSILRIASALFAISCAILSATAEPVTLRVRDLAPLQAALAQFDGAEQLVDGKAVRVPYKLAGAVRFALAHNLTQARAQLAIYAAARDALIQEASGGAKRIEAADTAALERFARGHEELLAAEVTLDLRRVTVPDLALDTNAVPVTTLAALAPILGDTLAPATDLQLSPSATP